MYTKTTKQKNNWLMAFALLTFIFSSSLKAQLSGTKTIGVDYPTLAAAVTDINALGVNGPLIINIPAGYTETAPLGGYVLTATGTLVNTITFQKNGVGANPLLTAYTGTATPTSAGQDGVFRLVGSDYVTIDGINITDPNTVNPATMEFGYALYKATADNGCQNNTIKNCVISLSRVNNATGTSPMVEGSAGIIMMNATSNAATTVLTPTLATGSNSNNKFYSNTIQNCNYGMALIGFAAATPFTLADTGNDIGGVSSATGNTIINYGGAAAATNPSAAIRTLAQYNINVSFNSINNNNGSGVNHVSTLRGIYLNTATSANAAITNNTVTLNGGGTTSQISAIENASGSTAATNTVVISNNIVSNSTYTTATSGVFYGIYNTASPSSVNISNNLFNGLNYSNSAIGGSGNVYTIYNTGATTTLSVISNTVINCAFTGTTGAIFAAIYPSSGTNQIITNNSINSCTISGTGTGGTIYGIRAAGTTVTISDNFVNDLYNTKTTGTAAIYGIYDLSSPTNETYNNNRVFNLSHSGTGLVGGMYFNTTTGTRILSNNNVYTLSSNGGTVYGLYNANSSPSIFKNKVYDLSSNGANGIVSGIHIISGTVVNIFNNIVGDLKTPTANNVNAISGINITGGTNVNAYYNSVYLNATSTGTLFGSSAINASSAATVDLRNNIFVNTSTPTGTAITVAYRRSSTTLTTYASTSNSNLFYAGTPSATTAIFYDGTTVQQTLANFKTLVGPSRDAASVTENPTFASTTGSNANFLHFNPATSTLAESGGSNISGITDDFDSNTRQGNAGYTGTGSSPDMGADEFEGVSLNLVINGLSITPTGNLCTAAPRVVTATVTPGASPLTSVELTFSFNGTGFLPVTMAGGSFTSTSTWTASIPAAFPTNANVTWTVTATDGTNTKVSFGTSYKDEPTNGVTATALSSSNPVCAGSTTSLSLVLSSTSPAPTSYCSATVSSTTEDDIGQVTFAGINNPATRPTPQQSNTAANGTYTDFTAITPAIVNAGQSYPITIYHFHDGTDVNANFCNVYIDYNQNGSFADAGETISLTKTGPFLSDFTGNITIPTTANMGLTRMRIIMKEGAITSSCGSLGTWGEVEDYLVSVVVTPTANISWTDGFGIIGTTNPVTATITANTTYTVTSDLGGCPVTAAVTVTNVPLPSAPIVSNSSQCGVGVPTASVIGGANYNWYATPTSTTVLQTGSAANFTTSIGATTTWYVTSVNGACESTPRAAVTTTVSIPDPVTANVSSSNLCIGSANTVTLTAVQTGTNNPYVFTWNASSTTGSGMTSSVTGTAVVITPTLPGTYTYSVTAADGICTTISTVTVGLNNPPSISATANPTVICSGSPVNLNAQSINASVATTTIGSGATTSSSGGSPFYYGWGGAKVQYIYTAAELAAQGLLAGNITSMGLNITSVGVPYEGFALSIGATTQSVFPTANTINSITQVYVGTGTNNSYTPVLGVNNFVFSTPFNWDGVSNVVISICWSNATTGGTSSAVKWDTYTGNKGMYIYSDSQTPSTVCSATTTIPASGGSSTTTGRPQTYFTGLVGVNVSSAMNFIWNPGAINSNTATVTPVNTGTTATTNVYTVTVTNTTTACSNTATTSVLVNPLPANPVVTNATQCGIGVPTSSVSGGTSYKWYATPTSTIVLQAGTSTNFTTSISNTTTWHVTSFNGTCESSPRVAVTQSVTIPDAVSASSSSTKLCVGGANTITLTATQTGTNSNAYVFTWTASPSSGSGIPTSTTGSVVSITPSTVGNYVYSLSASDGTCVAVSSVSVALNNLPPVSTTATPSVICSGVNVGLDAQSINIATGTATVGPTGFTSTTGTPYRQGNGITNDFKTQYLYTAAELNAAGIYAGNITDLRFNVTAAGSGMMDNFEIKMGATSTTSLGTAYDLPPSTVYGPYSYSVTLGQNIHTFDTPFNWDGISNVMIEICHDLVSPVGVSSTMNVQTISNRVVYSYTAGACGFASGTSTTTRPIIGFSGQIGTNVTSSLVWTWNPGAIPSSAATVTPVNTGSTAATSVYTVSVNNPATTCSNTGTVGVLVNAIPTTPVVTNTTQCGVGIPTSSVSGGTSYNWYATPTSTTVLQSGTSTNYTTSISNTTSWYVTSVSTASCQSPRAQVTTTVSIPDAVTASVSSASICPNTTVALIATNTGTTNTYSYTWTAIPTTGSGITGSVSGSSVSITPSISGNYVYSLTAVDGACTAVNTVSLNVFQTVATPTAIATPSVLCSGNSATLSLNSSANVALGSGTTTTQGGSGLSPYAQFYEGQRTQYLFKASELTAAGLSAGNITSMAFNVTAANATMTFTNYAIKMYHTTSTDLVTAFAANSSPIVGVFGPLNLPAPALGVNTHNFASPFNWDGSSNVIIDICFENDPLSTGTLYTSNTTVAANTVSGYTSVRGYYADNSSLCNTSNTGSSATSTIRPNITFKGNSLPGVTTINWTTGVTSVGTGSVVSITPTTTETYTATLTDNNSCVVLSTPVTVTVNTTPTVSAVASNTAVCSGSSATLTASGATSYTWTSGGTTSTENVTPTALTVYTVTGETSGCSNTATVSVDALAVPSVSVAASSASICSSNSTTLTASGATNYTWTSGGTTSTEVVTPASTTTYTVTGEATGCSSTATVSINVTATPTVAVAASNATICSGNSATLTASGATNYTWTSGGTTSTESVTPTALTVYIVTGETSGCSSTATVSVDVNTIIPTVTVSASSASVCSGSSATLTAGGATNYTWTSGGTTSTEVVTPTALTVYTVTGETNSCSNTATVSLGVNQTPTVSAVASQTLLCDDGSTGSSILTASSNGTTYLWSDGATTMTTVVTPSVTSVYTITATGNGCSANAFVTVTVNNCNGIKDLATDNISIFPNPTTGNVTISIPVSIEGNVTVEVYDAIGKLTIKENITNNMSNVNLSKLEDGMYMFKIINNNKTIKIGKIVKQ